MSSSALVSVVMPVRNGMPYLNLAIQSILQQTYENFELLILDDGSTDNGPDFIRSIQDPRIRFFCDGIAYGITHRLNEGIQHANGEYIARMDADDIAFKNRFQLQLDYLNKHPKVDLVAGKIAVIGKNNELLGVRRTPEHHQAIISNPIRGFPMIHPAFMGKVAWFRKFAYKQRIKCEDQDLLLRAMNNSCYANLQEFVLAYRETAIEPFKYREGRNNYSKALNDYYFKQTHYASHVFLKCRNALAFYRDWVALKTGLGYKLLPNRHLPPNSSEVEEWATERKNLASI